ncbi:hypothetical protein BH10PSE17_BH10PSE17_31780 [soil metagenome]
MIVDDALPKKADKANRAWVYVAIVGDDISEAVAVAVLEESGTLKLRIEAWGRP